MNAHCFRLNLVAPSILKPFKSWVSLSNTRGELTRQGESIQYGIIRMRRLSYPIRSTQCQTRGRSGKTSRLLQYPTFAISRTQNGISFKDKFSDYCTKCHRFIRPQWRALVCDLKLIRYTNEESNINHKKSVSRLTVRPMNKWDDGLRGRLGLIRFVWKY